MSLRTVLSHRQAIYLTPLSKMKLLKVFLSALLFAALVPPPATATANNAITQWNSALQRTIRKLSIANQISSRYLSLVHVAQYQALIVNKGRLNETAVAAFAAHFVASEYFPNEQSSNYDLLILAQTKGLNTLVLDAARDLAIPIAVALIVKRTNDGNQQWARFRFAPLNTVGGYQATPNQTTAVYPQLASTRPWLLPNLTHYVPQQFGNLSHAKVGTPQYDLEYQAVKLFGAKNSTARDPYQQLTPYFWADDVNTAAITGHWNNITALTLPSNISLTETAELYAKLNVAFYDSNIAAWNIKFSTLFWRPVTAVRQGDPQHPGDPSWTPLINTPGHPEFPSTHSVSSGAAAAVLARYHGTDNITFTIGSEYPNQILEPRKFTTFSSAAIEIANSRIYGGIHFPTSGPAGVQIGVVAGEYVYTNFKGLTPVGGPNPSVGQHVDIPLSDGSFDNLSIDQPQPGVEVPGPAPAFPSIALASELNGTALAPSSAPIPPS